jgi:hypothetical protein
MTSIGTGMANFGDPYGLTQDELERAAGMRVDEGFFSEGYQDPSEDGFFSEGYQDPSEDGFFSDGTATMEGDVVPWQKQEEIRRLREKAGVKTGFMDAAKDFLSSPEFAGAVKDLTDQTGNGGVGMTQDMANELAETYQAKKMKMPRLGPLGRLPGRRAPISVEVGPQPGPQPPYTQLRTDYGFATTQKMLPTAHRLKAKAKGMR